MTERTFAPLEWAAAIEARLIESLKLAPCACPLDGAEGSYKGVAATLVARTYAGPDVAYARFVNVHAGDELAIANVMVVAKPQRALPILGVDMVKLAAARAPLLVADAWPTVDDPAAHPASQPTREGPAWWQRWSSPAALLVRVAPDQAGQAHQRLVDLVNVWVNAFAASGLPESEGAARAAARSEGYLAAHREEDQTLMLLAKIFGAAFASRFIAQVMFPSLFASATAS